MRPLCKHCDAPGCNDWPCTCGKVARLKARELAGHFEYMNQTDSARLDGWIEREFSGLGRALRARDEPPLEGEPWMSMAEAKELTRRAVAEFSAAPVPAETCELCSTWTAKTQAQLDNRLRRMADAPGVAPHACPRCGSTAWATKAVASSLGWQCCLLTPDPGPWQAGVDDSADLRMTDAMHNILDNLSYTTPIETLIKLLRAACNLDSRTRLGWHIQVCLLSNAAHRLTLLARKIDPAPWRTTKQTVKDAWAVFKGRAVATYVTGTVYDRDKE